MIETWLSNFSYSSIAQKETEQKIRTLTNEKKTAFHLLFSEMRSAWDDVLSERIVYRLDPDKKKQLKEYYRRWQEIMGIVDYLEIQINETINVILNAFHECNELHNKYPMINVTQLQLPSDDNNEYNTRIQDLREALRRGVGPITYLWEQAERKRLLSGKSPQIIENHICEDNEEKLVPDVIPSFLFYLLNLLGCLFSTNSYVMTIQNDVISLFDNVPRKEGSSNDALEMFFDSIGVFDKHITDIIKGQEQANKDSKTILNELGEIKHKQTVSDTTIKRKIDKNNEKIEKRIKKESRCELTQMDCAGIIAEKRNNIDGEKRRFLEVLKLPTDKIRDTDTEEKREKRIKNIARTIERWDSGQTKPPAEYSRRISEYEFSRWVDKTERKKLEKWKERILRRIRNVSTDTLTEEQLHDLMEQNR